LIGKEEIAVFPGSREHVFNSDELLSETATSSNNDPLEICDVHFDSHVILSNTGALKKDIISMPAKRNSAYTELAPPSSGENDNSHVSHAHNSSSSNSNDNVVIFPELHNFRSAHMKQMVFGHLNINSLRNKFSEIYELLSHELIDIFGLSETKLDQTFTSSQFKVPDYNMYRTDRNAHGGGVMLYVKSTIPHRIRLDLKCDASSAIESLAIEVKLRKEKMFIVLLYKPPNVTNNILINNLGNVIDKCYVESSSVYILGDVNINFERLPEALLQFLAQYGLKNIVRGPTCYKNVLNPSQVDIILTSSPQKIVSHLNISLGLSDFHNLVCAATRMHAPQTVQRKLIYRSFKRFDETKFTNDLKLAPFHVCDIFDDTDDVMWSFNYLLTEVVDYHAPVKIKILRKPQLPYMNGELRRAINVKSMLKRKYNKCKDNLNWQKYRKQRNLVTSLKRKSIQNYFDQRCNGNTNKHFWKTVRPFVTNRQTAGSCVSLFDDDKLVTKPAEVVTLFNKHFIDIASDLKEPDETICQPINKVIEFYNSHPSVLTINAEMDFENFNTFRFTKVSSEEIFKNINQLKVGKTCGYDKIPARILKAGASVLTFSLTNFINRCIEDARFPDLCKNSEVTPVYKKGDPLKKDNYRPVSVLTALSKILECIMSEQLMNFFNDVLSPSLSAYRSMYSTNNVIINCIEEWKNAIDQKMHVGCVAMDLSKAFDSIPHNLLVAKLHSYGLTYNACNFIHSYLSHRKQRVKQNDIFSEWAFVKRGVPQGSVLGPVLFNIYLNDFILLLRNFCIVHNYADDNTLSFCHDDLSIIKMNLERASKVATSWFKENYMKANADKFQFMILPGNKSNEGITLEIGEVTLRPTNSIKLLGVIIDKDLAFDHHIQHISCQAAKQINVLFRLSQFLSLQCKLKIVDAFIISNLSYCSLAYHHCKVTQARKLENLLKRALRFTFLDFSSTYKELLDKANICPLYVSRLRTMLVTVYKILRNECPPMKDNFFKAQKVHYSLRGSNMLIQPTFNTYKHGFNSLRYQGASLWNNIGDAPKALDPKGFKAYVRSWQPDCHCGSCLLCTI